MRPDEIPNTRAAPVAWLGTPPRFVHTRYPDPDSVPPEERGYHRTVWWHELGADPATDTVLFDDLPDPTAWPEVSLSRDGRWFLFHVALGWDRIDVHLEDRTTGAHHRHRGRRRGHRAPGGRRPADRHHHARRAEGRAVEAPLDAPTPDQWATLVREGVR